MAADISRSTFDPAKRFSSVRSQQGRVALDADWNEQVDIARRRVATETIDVVGASGAPKDNAGFGITINNNVPVISAGRMYVNGVICENDVDGLQITAQAELPGYAISNLGTNGTATPSGRYLAYLDAWERSVTAVEDNSLLEPALGGPDTCARTRTIWQVKLLPVSSTFGCDASDPTWTQFIASSSAQLAAQAEPAPASGSPCVIAPTAGYTSLENHLYRVEVHDATVPSIVWSRENGSVATRWLALNGNQLTVEGLGNDSALGFNIGDWVEVTDDSHILNGVPGILAQISSIAGTTITVDNSTSTIVFSNFPLNPIVRRWDSPGAVSITAGSWVDLENGVQIEVAAPLGTLHNGDFWQIPARTGIGVLWPLDGSNNPSFQGPSGVSHDFCQLAVLNFDGTNWTLVDVCRPAFPTLSELGAAAVEAIHITAVTLVDGQVELANDSAVLPSQLANGIAITCDQPLDPLSLSSATGGASATCEVVLWLPYPLGTDVWPAAPSGQAPFFGTQPVSLNAQVSVSSNVIAWQPTQVWELTESPAPGPLFALIAKSLAAGQTLPPVLARMRLRGRYIWAAGNPTVRLDGASYGTPGSASTDVVLPSGNNERADDFEMWFWLIPPPISSDHTESEHRAGIGHGWRNGECDRHA